MTEEKKICCICGAAFDGYGNNPAPLEYPQGAVCCDRCNLTTVLLARMNQAKEAQKAQKEKNGGKIK